MSKVLLGSGLVFLLAFTPAGHAVAQTCIQLPSGLVSWWPGNGNADDIQDDNNGTLQNGTAFAGGKVGQAFSFNGNNQYVTIPAQVYSLQAGTVDFWVNWDGNLGSDSSDVFIGTWDGASDSRSPTFFVRGSGEILFELGDVVVQTTGVTLVPNMWYHLAMTYTQTGSSHNFNVYVNGVLTNSGTATGIIDFVDTILVGAYFVFPDRIEQFTQGRIDELEIFNRALSTAEIQAIYNAGSAGKCKEELASLGPATLWIGLKNSDDQGTQFDLRTEVSINDTLVAEGETRCITGVTRNPNNAKEVSVELELLSDGGFASGDVLSLTILTRIGTSPDNTKCAGPGGSHSNAVGLRLYYDSTNRDAQFGAEITPDLLKDFFLHAAGTDFFLDTIPPTATSARFKDSTSLNFAGGNPWKEIGTWSMTLP
jgi:hypothetical protein